LKNDSLWRTTTNFGCDPQDRGTIDGAAYWPDDASAFFAALATTHADELLRYDAVLFFESAAVGGTAVEGGNPIRIESIQESCDLDHKLRVLWGSHPKFVVVRHSKASSPMCSTGKHRGQSRWRKACVGLHRLRRACTILC
jgi:hypothetical protein